MASRRCRLLSAVITTNGEFLRNSRHAGHSACSGGMIAAKSF